MGNIIDLRLIVIITINNIGSKGSSSCQITCTNNSHCLPFMCAQGDSRNLWYVFGYYGCDSSTRLYGKCHDFKFPLNALHSEPATEIAVSCPNAFVQKKKKRGGKKLNATPQTVGEIAPSRDQLIDIFHFKLLVPLHGDDAAAADAVQTPDRVEIHTQQQQAKAPLFCFRVAVAEIGGDIPQIL